LADDTADDDKAIKVARGGLLEIEGFRCEYTPGLDRLQLAVVAVRRVRQAGHV